MQCPKCNDNMVDRAYGEEIKIKHCNGCGGIFCKREMLDNMRNEWLTDAVLDHGSAATGRRFNEIKEFDCPDCGTPMEQTRDEQQIHITLESCPSCTGVWLDAGELTDMKYVTVLDHVKDLITRFKKEK